MKNPNLILLLFWILFMASMSFQQYEIHKLNATIDKYQYLFKMQHQRTDSVIVNCFRCNSRNVRYLYPDTIIYPKIFKQ